MAPSLLNASDMLLHLAWMTSMLSSNPDTTPPPDTPSTVVGGTVVPEGKWRDVVAVIGADATCTGTLIAPDIVLTAGHCIDIEPYEVRTDTIDYASGGDRIPVKWARAYPNWESKYDVGVIMLDHVARGRARKIAPACAARDALVQGAMVHLVGFGLTAPDADSNTQLREVDVPIMDPTCEDDVSCQSAVAPHGEFLAGGLGVDSCFGDSGGPVFMETAEGPALLGVVSRGLAIPGAACGGGGVYVRADKIVSWAQSITGVDFKPAPCEGSADGDEGEEDLGGCSSGGGIGGMLTVLGLGIGITRRSGRRRATG